MVGSGNCFPEPLIPQGLASGLQNPDATDLGELLGEFSFKMKHASAGHIKREYEEWLRRESEGPIQELRSERSA